MKISILIPIYNGAHVFAETLRSLLSQSFNDFEIIVSDNNSSDNIKDLLSTYQDTRIKFFPHPENVGYPANLKRALSYASGEIIFLMGADDILGKDALKQAVDVYAQHPEVGAIARPYFAFDTSIVKPIRYKKTLVRDQKDVEIVSAQDDPVRVIGVFRTLDQLSGLSFRKTLITIPFHDDVFTCHVYPFANILKGHSVAFLPNYTIAVRVWTSQCKSIPTIYDKSPVESWIELFNVVFKEEKFERLRSYAIKNFCANNAVGLIQIRNYSRYPLIYLLREMAVMIRARPSNVLDPLFILISLGCLITPKALLIPVTDWVKENIISKSVPEITFQYD